jgi:outer membrane protein
MPYLSPLPPLRSFPAFGPAKPLRWRAVVRMAACGLAMLAWGWSPPAEAQEFRVGYVDLNWVMWSSDLSQAAQERLRQQRSRLELALARDRLPGDGPRQLERDDIARRRIEAEMQKRQIDELRQLHDAAVRATRRIAEQEQLDAVLGEAAYMDARYDLTARVLALMRSAPAQ